MEAKKTLTDFIDGIISDYQLPRTKRIESNIRKKFTETLKNNYHFKSKNVWENAETVKVAKTHARVFDSSTLKELLRLSQDYLVSLSNNQSTLTSKQLREAQKEMEKRLWQQANHIFDDDLDRDDHLQVQDATEKYCKKLKKEAVLDALFDEFYTTLQTKKIEDDQAVLYYIVDPTDEQYILADYRLDHPEGNYYEKKKVSEKNKRR